MTLYCSWHPRGWLTPTWIVFLLAVCCFFTSNAETRAPTAEECPFLHIPYVPNISDRCVGGTWLNPKHSGRSDWLVYRTSKNPLFLNSDTNFSISWSSARAKFNFVTNPAGDTDIECLVQSNIDEDEWTVTYQTSSYACSRVMCFPDVIPDDISRSIYTAMQNQPVRQDARIFRVLAMDDNKNGYYTYRSSDDGSEFGFISVHADKRQDDVQLVDSDLHLDDKQSTVVDATSGTWVPAISIPDKRSPYYGIYFSINKTEYQMSTFSFKWDTTSYMQTYPTDIVSGASLEYIRGDIIGPRSTMWMRVKHVNGECDLSDLIEVFHPDTALNGDDDTRAYAILPGDTFCTRGCITSEGSTAEYSG